MSFKCAYDIIVSTIASLFIFPIFIGKIVKLPQILYCIYIYLHFSLGVDTPLQLQNHGREELIKQYFNRGFSYEEILKFLSSQHDIVLSKRHLHHLLRQEELFRRKNKSTIDEVMDQIEFLFS